MSRKILCLVLALVMVMGLAVTAMAEEETPATHTITIRNTFPNHQYKAYQVFSGTYQAGPNGTIGVLSNIQWGSGVNGAGLLKALAAAEPTVYNTNMSADDVASKLKERTDAQSERVNAFAKVVSENLVGEGDPFQYSEINKNYTISVGDGYYFVKDATTTGFDDAVTSYMLRVARDNVSVDPKYAMPSVEKKVKDINDSTETTKTDWQDSADYDFGDKVPFQLKGTVINAYYNDYQTYKFVFHDTLSPGLTFDKSTVKVFVDNARITTGYTIATTGLANGETFNVIFDDLKALKKEDGSNLVNPGSVITVEYEATLNTSAAIGSVGNPNTVYLEFSNNPYGGGTSKTEVDKVIVFTYQTIINKVNEDGNPLTGAEFTLEKYDLSIEGENKWKNVGAAKVNEGKTTFSFKGLDDGKYRLTETKTPEGHSTIKPIEFEITAGHNFVSKDPQLDSISGTKVDGTDTYTGVITFSADKRNGSLSTDVVNKSGTTLPTTGGIGTTIFYVLGAVLVFGATVLLVTKKRMGGKA